MEYILNTGMPRILSVDMENFNPENLNSWKLVTLSWEMSYQLPNYL